VAILETGLHITLPEKNARQLLARGNYSSRKFDVDTTSLGPYDINQSKDFVNMTKRLERSRYVIESYTDNSPFINEADIEDMLRGILLKSRLEGFVIVTWDAFPVLEVNRNNETLPSTIPAIGVLLTETIKRSQEEKILNRPDELTMYGLDGEFIIIRYFQNLEWQFILMAYAKKKCPYRLATNCVMQLCEPLLADYVYV
jgi:hypothetical protein